MGLGQELQQRFDRRPDSIGRRGLERAMMWGPPLVVDGCTNSQIGTVQRPAWMVAYPRGLYA